MKKIEINKKIDVTISEQVMKDIYYLCRIFNQIEWSGALAYETEGDIQNLNNFKIHIKELIFLNKGSTGHVGDECNDGNNPLMQHRIKNINNNLVYGRIHSHNNMKVFYSATDMNGDIMSNIKNYNYYLNMIVNNKGDILCKIFSLLEIKYNKLNVYGKNNQGKDYEINITQNDLNNISIKDEILLSIPCNIINKYNFNDKLLQTIKDLEEKEEKQRGKYLNKYNHQNEHENLFDNNSFNTINKPSSKIGSREFDWLYE